MALGSNYLKVKVNNMAWTNGRLERSMKLAAQSELALKTCVETLKYDAETMRNLGQLDLAEAAFNASASAYNKQIGAAKKEVWANAKQMQGNQVQTLANKFKYAALGGS